MPKTTKLETLEKTLNLYQGQLPEIDGERTKLVVKKFLLLTAKFEKEEGETLDSKQDSPTQLAAMDDFERAGFELFNLARRAVPGFYEECVYALNEAEA